MVRCLAHAIAACLAGSPNGGDHLMMGSIIGADAHDPRDTRVSTQGRSTAFPEPSTAPRHPTCKRRNCASLPRILSPAMFPAEWCPQLDPAARCWASAPQLHSQVTSRSKPCPSLGPANLPPDLQRTPHSLWQLADWASQSPCAWPLIRMDTSRAKVSTVSVGASASRI
eukprot:15474731-Alexandrium_andersonii.AAC.1